MSQKMTQIFQIKVTINNKEVNKTHGEIALVVREDLNRSLFMSTNMNKS